MIEAARQMVGIEDDGRGGDGTCERPASGLVPPATGQTPRLRSLRSS